jgi:hypothetical protein
MDKLTTSSSTIHDDAVHMPELPGVRSLAKDAHAPLDDTMFTTPKGTLSDMHEAPASHLPEGQGGGKHIFDVERAFNDETVQEGTIVTDRKRKRMSTGTMLKGALTEWWGNAQRSAEATINKMEFLQPKDEPTVENAEARSQIIKEAAKHAKQAPRDDHTLVVEKVRTFAHDAEVVTGKPFTIKEPAEKIGAHWGTPREVPAIPESQPTPAPVPTIDQRSTTIAPAVVRPLSTPLAEYSKEQGLPQKRVTTPIVVPMNRPTVTSLRDVEKPKGKSGGASGSANNWSHFTNEKIAPLDLRSKIAPAKQVPSLAPRIEQTPLPRPTREPLPKSVVNEERVAVLPPTVPVPPPVSQQEAPAPEPIKNPLTPVSQQEHPVHIPRILLLSTIILVGGGLGVAAAVFVTSRSTPPEPTVTLESPLTIPSLLTTDTKLAVELGLDREQFYTSLLALMRTSTEPLVQYYPTAGTPERVIPATTEEIMAVVAPQAPRSFIRSLGTPVMFGSVKQTKVEPFIILQSSNFDTAFAGMLAWERTMTSDLAPLFSEQITPLMQFSDAITNNRAIRILKDEMGNEGLVYAFVNKNLILITTSTEALSVLIDRLK